jgi:hypothetical protein
MLSAKDHDDTPTPRKLLRNINKVLDDQMTMLQKTTVAPTEIEALTGQLEELSATGKQQIQEIQLANLKLQRVLRCNEIMNPPMEKMPHPDDPVNV